MNRNKNIRVAVGLSGGVDSSVAALLLKQAGYGVTAVFLTCWNEGVGCSTEQDRKDAIAVAAQLGIPIKIWNFQKEYQARVIDRFYEEYKKGRTPNPDIWCNEEIKFGLFLERALAELGVDYVATGHYARVVCGIPGAANPGFKLRGSSSGNENFAAASTEPPGTLSRKTPSAWSADTQNNSHAAARARRAVKPTNSQPPHNSASAQRFRGKVPSGSSADAALPGFGPVPLRSSIGKTCGGQKHLLTGLDSTKDQSYFLYRLNQFQLSHSLFPIGQLTKQQVREIAKQNNLLTAKKPDSQGICFVGKVDLKEFLGKRVDFHPGEVVKSSGEVIGGHDGVEFYTLGQRHGFRIDKYQGEPMYVIGKDVEKNRLVVGKREEGEVGEFEVEDVHWVGETSNTHPSAERNGSLTPKNTPSPLLYPRSATTINAKFSNSVHSGPADVGGRGVFPVSSTSNLYTRIRHLGELIPCTLKPHNSNLIIYLTKPTRGVAPGQHAVLYAGEEVLGGGVIKEI